MKIGGRDEMSFELALESQSCSAGPLDTKRYREPHIIGSVLSRMHLVSISPENFASSHREQTGLKI